MFYTALLTDILDIQSLASGTVIASSSKPKNLIAYSNVALMPCSSLRYAGTHSNGDPIPQSL